jgi:ABC-type amino acid transport substrate-binding protein
MNIKNALLYSLCITTFFVLYRNDAFSFLIKKHDPSVLRVGTSPDFPPYSFLDDAQNIVGFDIDVVSEIARRLGKKIEIQARPFASLIFDLMGNSIDVIAAGITPTQQRAQHVLFSQVYLQGDPLVALSVKEYDFTRVQDVLDKKIIVPTGYTSDIFISDYNCAQLTRLVAPAQCIMALLAGAGDVFIASHNSVAPFLKQNKNLHVWPIPQTGDAYALVLNKHNHELQQQVNDVIVQMQQDGTLDTLKQKWELL